MPAIRKTTLSHILATQNFDEFSRLVHDVYDLRELAEAFPDSKEALFECFKRVIQIQDLNKFSHWICDVHDLCVLAEIFPEYKAHVFEQVIRDRGEFSRIHDVYDLKELAEAFPDHKEELFKWFKRITLNGDEFGKLVHNVNGLQQLTEAFPDHKEQLFERIIQNRDLFDRLVGNLHDLRQITEAFPDHKEQLFERVIRNGDLFDRLVKDFNDLCILAQNFPYHKEQLLEQLIQDKAKFRKLINDFNVLSLLVQVFPDHKAQVFGWFALAIRDQYEFSKWTGKLYDVRNLAAIFPKYAEIFNNHTVEGVWKFIQRYQRYGEIEINALLLAETESYFSRLNPEILSRITVFASYHNIHNTPDAENIANELLSPAATSNS